MTLELGHGFTPRFGPVIEQMPALLAAGEKPISLDHALQQQYAHPETWGRTYIFTGDALLRGIAGDALINLDSLLLQSVHKKSPLVDGSLVISDTQWQESKREHKNLYLTAAQVDEAEGKGYLKKNGVWQPENDVVRNVWYHLGRGRDLRGYAELASEKSAGAKHVMSLYFGSYTSSHPILRAWCVNYLYYRSDAGGSDYLDDDNGRLVGVAPEARVSREYSTQKWDDLVTVALPRDFVDDLYTGAKTLTYQGRTYRLEELGFFKRLLEKVMGK